MAWMNEGKLKGKWWRGLSSIQLTNHSLPTIKNHLKNILKVRGYLVNHVKYQFSIKTVAPFLDRKILGIHCSAIICKRQPGYEAIESLRMEKLFEIEEKKIPSSMWKNLQIQQKTPSNVFKRRKRWCVLARRIHKWYRRTHCRNHYSLWKLQLSKGYTT